MTTRDPSRGREKETRAGKLPPTATVRERSLQAAARAEETPRLEAGDDARPYLPSSRRAGIMDASSSPWSPMVTPSGSQNSRRRCRTSPLPPPEEKAERLRGPARSKSPAVGRDPRVLVSVFCHDPGGKSRSDRGGADSRCTRPLFLSRDCVALCGCLFIHSFILLSRCSNLVFQRSRPSDPGLGRNLKTQQNYIYFTMPELRI